MHTPSLLCEIEQSMEQEELEQEREQVTRQGYSSAVFHTRTVSHACKQTLGLAHV